MDLSAASLTAVPVSAVSSAAFACSRSVSVRDAGSYSGRGHDPGEAPGGSPVTRLSIEAVAARAGVGKHTIYRRWPSKGLLFLDSVLSLNTASLDHRDTGDVVADLREVMCRAADLLSRPPVGPLYQELIGEAQHDPSVAAALNERFIQPQPANTLSRLKAAKDQGQLAPDFDLDLAFEILSGPLYFRFLITQEPLTHAYIDRILRSLFTGMHPRPRKE